jgi:tripartite-type tricarboxylate transporter receptor subunit TctC
MNILKKLGLNSSTRILAAMLIVGHATIGTAQEKFPEKPIRILVPSSPGSTLDIIFRQVGERLTKDYGQPVIIENRAGASGIIAYDTVAKAKPDGYTLAAVQAGFVSNRFLYKTTRYDVFKDYAPVAMVARSPMILVTRAESSAKNINEFREAAKAKPGTFTYASINGANQMNTELVSKQLNLNIRNIPYKETGQALNDVLSGNIDTYLMSYSAAAPLLASGKLRAFVNLGKTRLSTVPNVPTANELGMNVNVQTWAGLLAPAGTPEAVVNLLHNAVNKITNEPSFRERLVEMGFEPFVLTRSAYSDYMKLETDTYARVASELGLMPE